MRRPVRLPEFFKYIALFLAAVLLRHLVVRRASSTRRFRTRSWAERHTRVYFFIGWAILLSYLPLYWYRVKVEDPKHETQAEAPEPPPMPAGD